MEFKVLTCLPLSGEYEEYEYGSGGDLTAIKIMDENYLEYCAKFSVGINSKTKVQQLGSVLFVIAGGKGYLFDLSKKCLIEDIQIANFTDVAVSLGKNYFIACNNTDLFVFDSAGLVWSSDRISSDGININSVGDSSVVGQVYDFMNWVDFRLDFDEFVYHCDWKFPLELNS